MLYEFKSRGTGSLTMTSSVAERLLEIIGKSPGATGIITVDQMPAAIESIRRAVAHEPARPVDEEQQDGPDQDPNAYVSLEQRSYPLIEMMKEAQQAGTDITWGV